MFGGYLAFYAGSTAASAGLLGLLFVALTVTNRLETDVRARARTEAHGGSAFVQLVNVFFVSLVSLTGDLRAFAGACIAMALIGLYVTSQLLPPMVSAGNMRVGAPHWRRNRLFPTGSIAAHSIQLTAAVALLVIGQNSALLLLEFVAIMLLYAGVLFRAWEIVTL